MTKRPLFGFQAFGLDSGFWFLVSGFCGSSGFASTSDPNLPTWGQMTLVAATTIIVPMPPPTTEMMGPKILAVRPLSKPPSSLLAPMKMLLTAETRPRMWSGVRTWTSVWRTMTETLSKTPVRKSMMSER